MDCFYSHIFQSFSEVLRVNSTSDLPTVITSVVAIGMEGVSQPVKKKEISCPEAFSYLIVELKIGNY